MMLLLLGLVLFTGSHLATLTAPSRRFSAAGTGRGNTVKLLVTVASLLGLGLIVLGWRSADIHGLYAPKPWLRYPAMALAAAGIWLLVLSQRKSLLRRLTRHPQLIGLLLWSVAHLLLNGESRAVLLFAGLGVWSMLEMLLINARDGSYEPPPKPPLTTDLITLVLAAAVIALLLWAHPWIAGIAVV